MGLSILAVIYTYFGRVKNVAKSAIASPTSWMKLMAYVIPLACFIYVLYVNYLPFGYKKEFTIAIGASNDTKISEFYLEPSKNLSERKVDEDGIPYRELNGIATAVFKPKVALKEDYQITAKVKGQGVSIIKPKMSFDPSSVTWDFAWDFSTSTPMNLKGTSFHFDNCEYFDGKSRLELATSTNMFESEPFTIYAQWNPENVEDSFQEIVGHYNWELLQNKNSVTFRVGRMNDSNGAFYAIDYPISSDFFNKNHTVLATYKPSDTNGYIDMLVDEDYAGRIYLGSSKIYKEYNGIQNLSFGKSAHGSSSYFKGCINNVSIKNGLAFDVASDSFTLKNVSGVNKFYVIAGATSSLREINVYVGKK